MPGSLLNVQELHSNLSDVSSKSVDSRTSGKKVSFNKAVRVKQYPWQPDDYGEKNGTVTLPNQRFWFKVYKSNTHQDNKNSWKDNIFSPEESNEDALDSLMPIAEDDDASSDVNQTDLGVCQSQCQSSRFESKTDDFPPDPPIDYADEEFTLAQKNRDNLMNGTTAKAVQTKVNKALEIGSVNSTPKKVNLNGFTTGARSHDFKRPTISSAAKCITDSRARSPGNKQVTSSVRLPRTPVRESKPDRTTKENIKFPNVREKRSRSTDYSIERGQRETSKADKAVSTDDLSSDYKENQENVNKDNLWWRKKSNRDKATQHNGTFTKSRFNALLNVPDISSTRPALSPTSSQLRWTKRDDPVTKEHSLSQVENVKGEKGESYSDQNSLREIESKTLALRGRNCLGNIKNNLTARDISTLNKRQMYSNELKISHSDTPEYDYVTKDVAIPINNENVYMQPREMKAETDDETHRSFPWRTLLSGYSSSGLRKTRSVSSERKKDIHSLSESEYLHNTQTTGNDIGIPPISIPKIKNGLNGDLNDSYNKNDRGTSRGRYQTQLRDSNRRRSASSDRHIGREDSDQSMIDWSLSGFQLGSREDNKLSSSSDSECVVHRRPPLLMYIPGVSHHNLPAIEDDRLSAISGMSRSEAEDDISPLMSEFKRRHSMPRNGKLNWWKWKGSKKNLQQT